MEDLFINRVSFELVDKSFSIAKNRNTKNNARSTLKFFVTFIINRYPNLTENSIYQLILNQEFIDEFILDSINNNPNIANNRLRHIIIILQYIINHKSNYYKIDTIMIDKYEKMHEVNIANSYIRKLRIETDKKIKMIEDEFKNEVKKIHKTI